MAKLQLMKLRENGKLYYLVSDEDGNIYDRFEFTRFHEMPNLELYCFKVMNNELKRKFTSGNYDSEDYIDSLFVSSGLTIYDRVINMFTIDALSTVTSIIRRKTLVNTLNRFRQLRSVDKVDYYKDQILNYNYEDFDEDVKILIKKSFEALGLDVDKNELFREIMFLILKDDYERAIARSIREEPKRKERERIMHKLWTDYDLGNVDLQEDEE